MLWLHISHASWARKRAGLTGVIDRCRMQDALLHPQLPLLGFLMAAVAKGYILGRTLASACLRIIHDMAVVPVQDKAPKGDCAPAEGLSPCCMATRCLATVMSLANVKAHTCSA